MVKKGKTQKRSQDGKREESASAKILAQMRLCGMSASQVANALGIEETTFRQQTYRGVMRREQIDQLANLLNIESDILRGWGVREPIGYWNRGGIEKSVIPLPLLQVIAESGAEVSIRHISFLTRLQGQLKRPMSPLLIKELLAHLR